MLTHSHTVTPFDGSGKEEFLKTLWEKEKLLEGIVTRYLDLSHAFWATSRYFNQISIRFPQLLQVNMLPNFQITSVIPRLQEDHDGPISLT